MSKIAGETLEKLRELCAPFQDGVESEHAITMIHAVAKGFTTQASRYPDWASRINPDLFASGKHPLDLFMGDGMANHLNNIYTTQYKLEHGYVPLRFATVYRKYLGQLWRGLFLIQKDRIQQGSMPAVA